MLSPPTRSDSDTGLLENKVAQVSNRLNIQDIWAPFEWIPGNGWKSGGSPKGSGESAVVSKDVGNLFKRVVVLRVLGLKVADDISLAPLLGGERRNEAILSGKTAYFTDGALATHIHSVGLFHRQQLLHGVNLLLADEVGDGDHWPLTPVLPLHHHPVAEQLQRGVLIDAVPLGDVRYGEKLGGGKQIGWWRGRRNGWIRRGGGGLKTLPSVSSALWSHTWKLAPPPPAGSKYSLCAGWMGGSVCMWQVSISPRDVSKPHIFTGSSSFVISLQTVWRSSIILFNLLYLKRPRGCALVCRPSMRAYVYQKYRRARIRWAYYAG